jgi:hypothetical protein
MEDRRISTKEKFVNESSNWVDRLGLNEEFEKARNA